MPLSITYWSIPTKARNHAGSFQFSNLVIKIDTQSPGLKNLGLFLFYIRLQVWYSIKGLFINYLNPGKHPAQTDQVICEQILMLDQKCLAGRG